jgi:hypothetical protein
MNFVISVKDLDLMAAFYLYFTISLVPCHGEFLYTGEQFQGHHHQALLLDKVLIMVIIFNTDKAITLNFIYMSLYKKKNI